MIAIGCGVLALVGLLATVAVVCACMLSSKQSQQGQGQHMNNALSPPQFDIMAYIISYMRSNGYAPTMREICDGCGISSTSVVSYHLERIERKGYISRTPKLSRSIVPNWERINDMLQEVTG